MNLEDRPIACGQVLWWCRRGLNAEGDVQGVIGGSKGAAARLGVKRTTLLYKMEKLGISRQPS